MPAGILPHFLDVIGASGLAVAAAALPRVNRRIGAKHLAMMRLINMALAREMTDHALRVRVRRRLTQTLPGVLGDDAPFVGLDGERRLAVRRHFADSNARLAGEYGIDDGCPAGGCFWTMPGEVDVPPIRIAWADLTPEERAAVTQLARDTAGVDLASMSDRVDDIARTDPRRGRPSRPIRRAKTGRPRGGGRRNPLSSRYLDPPVVVDQASVASYRARIGAAARTRRQGACLPLLDDPFPGRSSAEPDR